ncbi:MAG: YlbF family regulator [Phycisphaerae bacterium]
MADTQEILAAAGNLGALVATHPTVVSYKETIRQLDLDVGAKSLLQQYEQLIEQLSMKEAQMQPIEVAEKKQFEQLQQSIMMNQTLKKFATVQGEYMDLMKKVQETINEGMSGKLPAGGQGGGAGGAGGAPAAGGGASKIILDT